MKSICLMRVRTRTFSLLTLYTLLVAAFKGDAQPYVTLHQMLNHRCNNLYKELCSEGFRDFCKANLHPTVRKGVGSTSQTKLEYRCYGADAVSGDQVDVGPNGVWCLDDCGKEVRCRGTVKRHSGSFHATRHTTIARWIEEEKPKYCSSLQSKFDAQCLQKLANSIGRIMDDTPNGEMVCVSREAVDFAQDAFCFNHCGTPSLCPGKPNGNVVRLPADMRATLMKDFKRPCGSTEKCVQPRGMPVQCEKREGPEEGMLLGDGEEMETEFSSPDVTVTAETCLHAELDLGQKTIRIGRAGGSVTSIPVPISAPPYKLSLQRTGNELKLKLVYNNTASGSNVLYFAQPGAACLTKEPLKITGLDEGAQFSHKNERQVHSGSA